MNLSRGQILFIGACAAVLMGAQVAQAVTIKQLTPHKSFWLEDKNGGGPAESIQGNKARVGNFSKVGSFKKRYTTVVAFALPDVPAGEVLVDTDFEVFLRNQVNVSADDPSVVLHWLGFYNSIPSDSDLKGYHYDPQYPDSLPDLPGSVVQAPFIANDKAHDATWYSLNGTGRTALRDAMSGGSWNTYGLFLLHGDAGFKNETWTRYDFRQDETELTLEFASSQAPPANVPEPLTFGMLLLATTAVGRKAQKRLRRS